VPAGGDWWRALRARLPNATAVVLSEALIFDYRCAACGDEAASYVGRRADEFDDRIATCARCGEQAVRIDVRAEATVDELRRLGRAPPVKFLLAAGDGATLCIDLEV
jgi:DNA-directed RNA polymerase subunit RPC12/RpoP